MNTRASGRQTDLPTIALLALMYLLFFGNFAVYEIAPLPLPIHFAVSVLAIHLSFTIWHEAAHGSVSPRAWVNRVVGVLGMFPYMTPFFTQRHVHLEHHRHMNAPGDPNVIYTDGSFSTILFRYPRALAYAREILRNDPRSPGCRLSDALSLTVLAGIFAAGFWVGLGFELVVLWLLPLAVAKLLMDWYINYVPHVGLPPDRFKGTRILDVPWLTPLVLCHNYHAVHHLWPHVPWHRYTATYRDKLDYLLEHGVPIQHRIHVPRAVPAEVEH